MIACYAPIGKGAILRRERAIEFHISFLMLVEMDKLSVLGLSVSGQPLPGQLALKDQ